MGAFSSILEQIISKNWGAGVEKEVIKIVHFKVLLEKLKISIVFCKIYFDKESPFLMSHLTYLLTGHIYT